MNNISTDEVYGVKREIITYSKMLSKGTKRPKQKFIADMLFGLTASGSTLLSSISDVLRENTKKANTIERLARHLAQDMPRNIQGNYIECVKKDIPENPIVLLDNTDIIKPCGERFESLGRVRDGSSKNDKIENGYFVCEATALTSSNHPISLYSRVFSQKEEGFVSETDVTFESIDVSVKTIQSMRSAQRGATFIGDRGYDNQRIFNYIDKKSQNFIVRARANRDYLFKGEWHSSNEICSMFKGKYKVDMLFTGKSETCYVTPIKARVKKFDKDVMLLIVYRPGKQKPMLLLTNKKLRAGKEEKENVLWCCYAYRMRWRIEEYFKFKKQSFGFENFRVRNLEAINNLNTLLSYAITFVHKISDKAANHKVKCTALNNAGALKDKIYFLYYRIAKGLKAILRYCKTGIKEWFKKKRNREPRQLTLKLTC
jgi:hypothetical protein